jgi:hypothetical protein
MDYGKQIRFPMTDKDWISKVIIGGLLSIFPIINFIAYGYEFKVMKNAMNKKPGLPEWKNFIDLFMKGLIIFIIVFIFMIVPMIIFGFLAGVSIISNLVYGFSNPYAIVASILPALIIGGILILIIGFILPMAIAMYIKSDKIDSAFKFNEIINRIKSVFSEYLTSYIVILILGFILGLIMLIPYIGWILFSFGTFYLGLVFANMFGELYLKSKPV